MLQVLVSTMYQTDHSLLDRMNINSDIVVINQCDRNETQEFEYHGHSVKWVSVKDRGVGKSRNQAILHSTSDILLFSDDDVIYSDGYENTVISTFEKYSHFGLITFNLTSLNPNRPEYIVAKDTILHTFNCLRYGAFRIAVKRETLLKVNVFFSLLFGGGAVFQAGEDNIFIMQFIKHGVKCLASEKSLGTVKQEKSTWFKGYDKKYYFDRGALTAVMYGKRALFFTLLLEIKEIKKKRSSLSLRERIMSSMEGIKSIQGIL